MALRLALRAYAVEPLVGRGSLPCSLDCRRPWSHHRLPLPKRRPHPRTARLPRPAASIPFGDGQVHRYRLDNGLTVLVLVDRSAPVLSYHTWYRVGSRHEQPGKTGLSHLFEHLMFNETEHLPAGEFDRTIEEAQDA